MEKFRIIKRRGGKRPYEIQIKTGLFPWNWELYVEWKYKVDADLGVIRDYRNSTFYQFETELQAIDAMDEMADKTLVNLLEREEERKNSAVEKVVKQFKATI